MKIISPNEDKIIVDLNEQDLKELDITYERMDYSTIETRRAILTVLEAAGKALGRDIDPSCRMMIEAFPSASGCTLCFTIPKSEKYKPKSRYSFKKRSEYLVCDFFGIDALLSAASMPNRSLEGGLYELNGRYRLLISSFETESEITASFSEYGNVYPCDKLEGEFIKEHWNKLADPFTFKR